MLPEKLLSLGVQKLIDDGFAAQPYPRQHLSIEQVEYLVKKVNQQDNRFAFSSRWASHPCRLLPSGPY